MMNFVPIFPLGIVVYPGETLNLHIFEPRYKQLIQESYAEAKPFGMPVVLANGIAELGTLVEVSEVVEIYEDGKMDIRCKGLRIFRALEYIKQIPDKLYSGAIVDYLPNQTAQFAAMMQQVLSQVRELHRLLQVQKDFKKPDTDLISYDVAHHTGLTLDEEYEFLSLMREEQRLEYLKRHLQKTIQVVTGTEKLKEKIQLNGHFRELKGFNFDL